LELPRLAESLAGRIEIHRLWPRCQGELAGKDEGFIDAVFQAKFKSRGAPAEGWPKLVDRLARGGYPEMLNRTNPDRRRAWFGSYLTSILQRDVRDISNIRDLAKLPRLLTLVASRPAALLDYADLARGIGIPQTTLKRYMALLEATFLVQMLPAWFTNIGKRLVKSPKMLLNDTGLLTHLIGADASRLRTHPTLGGGILENFVVMEMLKQRGWSKLQPALHHFRTHNGDEVGLRETIPLFGLNLENTDRIRGERLREMIAQAGCLRCRWNHFLRFRDGIDRLRIVRGQDGQFALWRDGAGTG
jgi:predicted AAA+ superfamily ATPase